jgi:tetratricopeptide (TPR) repeat protein
MNPVARAEQLYNEGNFREAEQSALRSLQSPNELPPVDRANLYRLLGFTCVALGENEKAKQHFESWLELDPLANLDSVYVSPKIISVFREAAREFSARKAQPPPPDTGVLTLQVGAFQRSLLFPGLGQLHRNQRWKGYSLLTSEVLLLGTVVYAQIRYDEARDRYLQETNPARMQDLYDETNDFYHLRNGAAVLAAAVYLYSLFDAAYLPPDTNKPPAGVGLQIAPDLRKMIRVNFRLR